MSKFSAAISSMRLRTLPLSLAGVILGSMLAVADFQVNPWVVALVCLTTVCLQVLSNLCNELGDVLHGTDTAERQGPAYGLNGGELTICGMKGLIAGAVVACCVSGAAMIHLSFGTFLCMESICLLLLGGCAIAAAMRYTLGRNPYGYRGLGDLYVFLFFGIVSVTGSYFVCAHTLLGWKLLLPAAAIGFFSMGVLNVNNIRDMATDAPNRRTVAIRLGVHRARIYQTVLICLGWICMIAYCALRFADWKHWIYFAVLPLFILHLRMVWTRSGRSLDPALPMLVMSTFALAVLASLGFCAYLF
ncbi:MAG: 1,4-dihydroxy-2-naphthoate octaprenyltransferase [Bacteroidales bacterium]|nr:1,4-dihydroxy-2-naphthoate octaprenyltransferase [Bacteroidales bacterium]